MVNKRVIAKLIRAGCLLLYAASSRAQDQPQIHFIEKPTSKAFIDALNLNKGVEPIAGKPHCQEFKDVRGVTPKAVASFEVHFAFNSHELSPEAKKDLDQLGEALNSPYLSPYCFRIEGHTDSVGGDAYNQALSVRRANSVVRYLADHQHVDETRLLPVGYGETHPVASNDTEEGRQKNRRAQVANLDVGPSANNP
ncbi:MAG TPA: OmpA family protein [Methylomirabilota bacterium]|nr:OmpA family protein [Methylomirabilota bacterium]